MNDGHLKVDRLTYLLGFFIPFVIVLGDLHALTVKGVLFQIEVCLFSFVHVASFLEFGHD